MIASKLKSCAQQAKYACDLTDALVPSGRGDVVMLYAYFDAETQQDTFCVSGLAFGPYRAKKATRAWQRLWGDVICHMTDFHNKKGVFAEWEAEFIDDRMKQCISLMRCAAI